MTTWLRIAAFLFLAALFHAADRSDGQSSGPIPVRITAATLSSQESEFLPLADTPLAATVSTTAASRLSTSEVPLSKPRSAGSASFSTERSCKHQQFCPSGVRHAGAHPIPRYTRAADKYIYGQRKIII